MSGSVHSHSNTYKLNPLRAPSRVEKPTNEENRKQNKKEDEKNKKEEKKSPIAELPDHDIQSLNTSLYPPVQIRIEKLYKHIAVSH